MITAAKAQSQIRAVLKSKKDDPPVARAVFYSPNGDGNTAVPNRPGYAYALIGGAIAVVRATKISAVEGLPIFVTTPDISNGNVREAVAVDYDAVDSWDGTSYDVPPHNHSEESGTPVYVTQSQIAVGLPFETNPPSALVIIPQFYYNAQAGLTEFPQTTTTTLLGLLPASGYSKWVMISVNYVTGAYALTASADWLEGADDPTDYFSAVPAASFILADVRIESNTTVVTQPMIYAQRRAIIDTGAGAMPVPTVAGQILFCLDGSTWAAVSPLAGDNGELLTDDNGEMVVSVP